MLINCGEIYNREVKVLAEIFYYNIAAIKLLQILLLKFCLTLDGKPQRNVVA